MGNYISFKPQDASLPTYVRLVVTKKGFQSISKSKEEALAILTRLSASRVLLATKAKWDKSINLFTPEGILLCSLSDEGDLLITGFSKNNLVAQNRAMKYGVCFQVTDGIIIQIKLQGYEYYFDIANGRKYADNAFYGRNAHASTNLIMERIAQVQEEPEEESFEEEQYQPDKELAELLQLSESYSILSSQLEELKAKTQGSVAYSGITPLAFDRIDRPAYRFGVEGLDESIFKTGVQVEIEDANEERHAAEIIGLVKEDSDSPATAADLLFNEQVNIRSLPAQGWFNLSFSTVNKDVQMAANERIRSGEAQARYMDAVLGRKQPTGFENKDLSALMAKLDQEKYPPNASQKAAISAGINTKDVFLVMGPPGTGKTTVILQWVRYFVTQEHKRVLVSSQNNKAVDNVLSRIAEEKDIDVIRIGSEAKLQSDVIPFMFENKVAALRRSISEDTEDKRRVIDRIADQWASFADQLRQVARTLEQQNAHHTQLTDAVLDTIQPLHRELLQWQSKYQDRQREKQLCIEKINTLAAKLLKHEQATNFLARFFTGIGYKSKLAGMRQLIALLEQMRKEMETIADEYRQCRVRYDAACAKIRDTLYLQYERSGDTLAEQFRTLPQKPPVMEEDIWDLFGTSRQFPLNAPADCAAQEQQLQQDLKKAMELKEVLSNWRTDMESKQNYALNEIVLESVDLVGATCIGINSQKRFANLDFDVTIIDEAGQIQVHNALVPMSVSNKLIMLGDHKQIPPSADQELLELCAENSVDTNLLEKSLFEEMYNTLPESNKMMLDTQYRMPGEIADTISEWFYDGEYYSPDFKRGLKSLIPALSGKPYVIIDTSAEPNRYETKIEGAGSSNNLEASIVAELIQHLASDPENDLRQIGVISAYKSQVRLIKKKISRFLGKELVNEMVASLDSYQGQERDIIVYSFTKSSNTSPFRRRIGFLNELRRLNVAMTRCKKMLVLVGDMRFLGGCKHCEKNENGEPIVEKSELEFSNFINKMLADVRSGKGELITCQQFKERMKGADET